MDENQIQRQSIISLDLSCVVDVVGRRTRDRAVEGDLRLYNGQVSRDRCCAAGCYNANLVFISTKMMSQRPLISFGQSSTPRLVESYPHQFVPNQRVIKPTGADDLTTIDLFRPNGLLSRTVYCLTVFPFQFHFVISQFGRLRLVVESYPYQFVPRQLVLVLVP